MALLTAEDVLNKAFSKTKYREGFDQDEVDDFLDEVAHTVSSLIAERDDLAARLQQAQSGGGGVEAAPLTEAGGIPGTSGLLGAATDPNPPSPAGMLAMAQKLHDEYVDAGEAEKERIVDEAKTKAESIVEQAQHDAKARMDELAGERSDLERKIDDLRRFERDYRARLKTFLENLLGDLDHGKARESTAPELSEQSVVAEDASVSDVEWPQDSAADDDASADEPPADEDSQHSDAQSTDETESSAPITFEPDESEPAPAEPEAHQPPVRQSFGYQPPTPAPEGEEQQGNTNSANPFAPVTEQTPLVSGDGTHGDNGEPPRYPNAF